MSTVPWLDAPWTGPVRGLGSELEYARDGETALRVHSSGPCPRCGHPVSGYQWLVSDVAGLVQDRDQEAVLRTIELRLARMRERGVDAPRAPAEILQEMACGCPSTHDDADGVAHRGCGAVWTLRITVPEELR